MKTSLVCALAIMMALAVVGCERPQTSSQITGAAALEPPSRAASPGQFDAPGSAAGSAAPAQSSAGGAAPPPIPDLRDPGLTSKQRLDLGLAYVKQTLAAPSEPGLGLGGGPVDDAYNRAQVFAAIGQRGSVAELRAARAAAADPVIVDGLTVSLGFAHDTAAVPELSRILTADPDARIRQTAGEALGKLKAREALPALRAALKDHFVAVTTGEAVGSPGQEKIWPVRREAAWALEGLGETVPESVWRRPLKARDEAQLVASILEDKESQSCLAAVAMLGRYGQKGRPYLEAFVKDNAENKDLADSVKAAQEILAKSPQPGK